MSNPLMIHQFRRRNPAATRLQLMLLTPDAMVASAACGAGLDGVVVDWESGTAGGADLGAASHAGAYLHHIRKETSATVICVINEIGEATEREIDTAIGCGATEVLVPGVGTAREVEGVLRSVNGRCGVGVVIETLEAVERAADIANLPLARTYVDLDDLASVRGSSDRFQAVRDGTVERLRGLFAAPFGFGALTLPDRRHPRSNRLLIGEMARLGCDYALFCGSFVRDSPGQAARTAVAAVRAGVEVAFGRTAQEVWRDQLEFEAAGSLGGRCRLPGGAGT